MKKLGCIFLAFFFEKTSGAKTRVKWHGRRYGEFQGGVSVFFVDEDKRTEFEDHRVYPAYPIREFFSNRSAIR